MRLQPHSAECTRGNERSKRESLLIPESVLNEALELFDAEGLSRKLAYSGGSVVPLTTTNRPSNLGFPGAGAGSSWLRIGASWDLAQGFAAPGAEWLPPPHWDLRSSG